jgi:5-methylcytosine-specific restriction endonuclease McrBC regulatory subunit McrC
VAFTAVPVETSPDIRSARADLGPYATEELVGLLDLAELIVKGVSALPEDAFDREQPASVWINVEAIFEQAVRKLVAELLSSPVHAGRGDSVQLLRDGESLEADPDIVIHHAEGTVIIDAKYRRHGTDVSRPELYQLMAHALAYEARHAALVTPRIRATDTDRFLGIDSRDCIYDVVAVDTHSADLLRTQLEAWLVHCGATAVDPADSGLVSSLRVRAHD